MYRLSHSPTAYHSSHPVFFNACASVFWADHACVNAQSVCVLWLYLSQQRWRQGVVVGGVDERGEWANHASRLPAHGYTTNCPLLLSHPHSMPIFLFKFPSLILSPCSSPFWPPCQCFYYPVSPLIRIIIFIWLSVFAFFPMFFNSIQYSNKNKLRKQDLGFEGLSHKFSVLCSLDSVKRLKNKNGKEHNGRRKEQKRYKDICINALSANSFIVASQMWFLVKLILL